MMAQLPYGANILINSDPTKSSVGKFYTKSHPDYITSMNYPSTITFNYSEQNCELVGISTNLTIIDWNTTNKTFTLSNEGEVFNNGITPDIALLCNNVKLPIIIGNRGNNFDNKWYRAVKNNNGTVNFYARQSTQTDYVQIRGYYLVSWDQRKQNKIFIKGNYSSSFAEEYFCDIYYDYIDDNGEIQSDSIAVFHSSEHIPSTGVNIILPKLDGTRSQLTDVDSYENISRRFYKRLYVAIGINLRSELSTVKSQTYYRLGPGTHELYTLSGIPAELKIASSSYKQIESYGGLPKAYNYGFKKWHSDLLYKVVGQEQYISPSTSVIEYISSYDAGSCECGDCDGGCDESPQRHLVIDANTSDGYYWDTDTQQYIRFVSFQVPIGTEIWSWEETDATYFYDYEYYDPVEQRTTDKVRTLKTQAHIVE